MTRLADRIERLVVTALLLMMSVVVVLATVELGWIIARDVFSPPVVILELPELLDIFGFFLVILIGLELLETVKAYLTEHVVHVELVVEVALIAVARKVIVLDVKEYSPLTLLGVAAIILALAIAYHLQRRRFRKRLPG
ncbi:MAG TPA: phosphate-starvation-inducible PsiE family protein [Candidatus Binatia bacterium]|nr:phosphate-starvation-inducible PsiE family protein [Candidatus Binatia bacterium]